MEKVINELTKNINHNDGILRLKPAWVARNFIAPGRRFNLPDSEFNLGSRGGICERWLASTTVADNKVCVPDEGLSFLVTDSERDITLKAAVELMPDKFLGSTYTKKHNGLKRLAKIFDYSDRIPYHIHQMQKHASLVGRNSKDEAYYFPEGVNKGSHPETYFGVHPYIVKEKKFDLLLPHLVEWKDDSILQHAFAFSQIEGDGFHIPSGITHAPGTALTIELQEDSDVFAMMQAKVGETFISKDLLWKDVREEDRQKYGEKIILDMIDWNNCGDPEFYNKRHTPPILVKDSAKGKSREYWIFYNTNKFSGKKLYIAPGEKYFSRESGVYNILVWRGSGLFGVYEVEGGNPERDEVIVLHDRAVNGVEITNTGDEDLEIIKFFGPDINQDVPIIS